MSTKDIDTRIREKARKELKDRLEKLFEPAFQECSFGNATKTSIEHLQGEFYERQPDGVHKRFLSANQCLQAAMQGLYERLVEEAEEQSIADFINRVESLQEQIDDLCDQVAS